MIPALPNQTAGWLLPLVAGLALAAVLLVDRSRRRAARGLARLAERERVGAAVSAAFAEGRPLDEALRPFLPAHADWAAVHLLEEGHVWRTAVVSGGGDIERRLRDHAARVPFSVDAPTGPARVFRTGEPEVGRAATPALVEGLPHEQLLRDAGLGSYVSVPVRGREAVIGVLSLCRAARHGYGDDDVAWVQDVATRIGLGIENDRLSREAHELFEQTISANYVSTPGGQLIACNQNFAALLGFKSTAEALATSVQSYYADPEERSRFVAEIRTRRRLVSYELALVRRDGKVLSVAAEAIGHFNDQGDLTRISGFLVDRTVQKELEDQLRQKQRLEAVGQLAGGIAHDFNNLLTVIMGCTELLKVDGGSVIVDGHNPLDELSHAAQRAASLTQQLLAFSRRQVLQPRVVHLNHALHNVHSMLRRLVPPRVVLMLDLDPRIERIQVDPGQLDQVVVNLVVNAVDAISGTGTITLKTSSIDLTERDVALHPYVVPGRYVAMSVADTGAGMDEATRARVFEPFFTTKPPGKGTGLGLSTVYGIVKQSGGYVWIASTPGGGTTVKVCFPASLHAATA